MYVYSTLLVFLHQVSPMLGIMLQKAVTWSSGPTVATAKPRKAVPPGRGRALPRWEQIARPEPTLPSHWLALPTMRSALFRPAVRRLPAVLGLAAAVLAGLILATWLVQSTGGTQFAYPYLIVLPVILAAAVFKLPGGLLAALAAGLLMGPFMPLDTTTGTMQSTHNWLVRTFMYLVIGGFAGVLATLLDYAHRRALALQRLDAASGLLSPVAAGLMAAELNRHVEPHRRPTHAVVIEFGGHDQVVLAMGIDIGDGVIRRLAVELAKISGTAFPVTRIHGATFGALLPGGRLAVSRFLDRCQQQIPTAITVEGVPLAMMPRFGIASLTDEDRGSGLPFRKALVALQSAQSNTRLISRYTESLDLNAHANLALLADFRTDLEAGRCEVHLQPKLSLAEDRIIGAEALVRWTSDTHGKVPPGRFIPMVENTLLIHSLTRFMVGRSAQLLSDWHRQGLDLSIAVNISMRNLEDEDLVQYLIQSVERLGLPAGRLELEITETALMQGLQVARHALNRLREAGFSIAIDDFGTGYSSLSYLKELPVDWVKLDQSFVRDLPANAASVEIAAATAMMCQRLGYRVIAEGVENPAAQEHLRRQGYDAIQGYHLAAPMPADAFCDWVRARQATGDPVIA